MPSGTPAYRARVVRLRLDAIALGEVTSVVPEVRLDSQLSPVCVVEMSGSRNRKSRTTDRFAAIVLRRVRDTKERRADVTHDTVAAGMTEMLNRNLLGWKFLR